MVTAQQSYKISFYPATVTIEASRGAGDERLSIDRVSGKVSASSGKTAAFAAAPQRTITAHGVMGLINLQRGPYLVLVSRREAVGSIGSSTVYRVTETQIVKVASDNRVVEGFDALDEATYRRLLENALAVDSFYYSYDMDLTNSLERQQQKSAAFYKSANDEFFFNKYLAEPFIAAEVASAFVLPMIHGFFECRQVMIRGAAFNYVLVTRRGRNRQGTRYFSRGADPEGNVSNFAETEQIVDFAAPSASVSDERFAGVQMSYVQLRGSIPIVWAQVVNMRYVPILKIDLDNSRDRFERHMSQLIAQYNEVVAVNLVNKVSLEKRMGDAFAELSAQYKNPLYHYTHFDFHKECSKMRWDRISKLIEELTQFNHRFGYFKTGKAQGEKPAVQQLQTGVIRTNCMDCLDRTNVVQSELARVLLVQQLRDIGVFSSTDTVAQFPALRSMLNNVWADNADAVSCAYSGTGALKTDFTRTGKRSYLGALQDGRNSIERYIRGNFFDGERQDAIDLLLGKFKVRSDQPSPFTVEHTQEGRALMGTMYVCLFMLVYALFYPRGGHWFGASNVAFCLCWVFVLALVFVTVRSSHTAEMLSWPRLSYYPYRPAISHANASLKLPLFDRLLSNADAKTSLRSDDIKKAWPTDKKLA
ncbi:Phosphoinositide phosphatase sac1 [Coemansia sp. RSA 988]|nr:Phosphoinositide phosphatase sac1 [Coemansia sp. RSA 988]